MRLPWDVRLGNVAFKPICGRTLLILSFSQHSPLFVNSLILFYGISPCPGALRPVSRGKPIISDDVYLAPNATILGKVSITIQRLVSLRDSS
jgi:hypothetical protein